MGYRTVFNGKGKANVPVGAFGTEGYVYGSGSYKICSGGPLTQRGVASGGRPGLAARGARKRPRYPGPKGRLTAATARRMASHAIGMALGHHPPTLCAARMATMLKHHYYTHAHGHIFGL